MTLDTFLGCLLAAFAACVLIDLVHVLHRARVARSRRPPVVLFGTERSMLDP